MDDAKVLELAREAFGDSVLVDIQAQASAELLAFARLVAEAEREACAVLADDMVLYTGLDVAEAIRSRTERS